LDDDRRVGARENGHVSLKVAAISVLAIVGFAPATAQAYSDIGRFDLAADAGGGGGRWFTGAPADGFTCAVCHGEPDIPFEVRGLPEDGYRGGESYVLSFDMGESDGDASMVLEVTNREGAAIGTLSLLADTEVGDQERCRPEGGMLPVGATELQTTADGRPIAVTRACGARIARINWTAPVDETAGTAWIHAAAVRGNGNGLNTGDRTGVLSRSSRVEGAPDPEMVVAGGCATTGGYPGAPWILGFVLLLLGTRRKHLGLQLSIVVIVLASAPTAHAVPGPATTAVLANADVPESVALAERYARERDVPEGQVCALPIDEVIDLDLDTFRTQVLTPLRACLDAAGARERIEAIVVIRGVPLRVDIPDGASTRRVSLAAALGLWESTADGAPLLGQPPGVIADCSGTPCYAAAITNPFTSGIFEPGWERSVGGIDFRPVLVTMLHGRSFADAEMLLDSALAAEEMGGAEGEFLFMEGRDPARGILDGQYPGVISDLMDRGYGDASQVPFDADLTGLTLAAFFTGTATLGTTIEGNDFAPGALVDNVTSFGAVPENFADPPMERQVSIARWVARGVAGVHGTTDEPLNSVFPSRALITHYVDGATLAETYHRNLPNVYWRNLVLGDPMLAPYAVRPDVTIEGAVDGETIADARELIVAATDAEGMGVDVLRLYRDGNLVMETAGESITLCLDVPPGESTTLLAVAQKRDDLSDRGLNRPKGWLAIRLAGGDGAPTCADEDAGADDGGMMLPDGDAGDPDAGIAPPVTPDGGCGCVISGSDETRFDVAALAVFIASSMLVRTRRRR
jgi:uncharacterized protein (TIGR03790 family)